MGFFKQMILPYRFLKETARIEDLKRYRKLWWYTVILTLFVAQTPLLIMVGVNYYMYSDAIQTEYSYDISRNLFTISRSLKSIVDRRLSALRFVVREKTLEELLDHDNLSGTFSNLKSTFEGFVDLGVIRSNGIQEAYIGPYNLQGDDYSDQPAFHDLLVKGVHVSDVFMGHRKFPHFVIAVKHELNENDFFVLRATVDMESLNKLIHTSNLRYSDDVFILSSEGILQTPSYTHGNLLEQTAIELPPKYPNTDVILTMDDEESPYLLGYSYIEDTPFILMMTKKQGNIFLTWIRKQSILIAFFLVSTILIYIVVFWSSTIMVQRIRSADLHRTNLLLKAEYTNKMATIGRLSASVAHEINNPLAIINEKAGLLTDFVAMYADEYPQKEKTLKSLNSIISSVDRCRAVTHRLLGFTRSTETKLDSIDPSLLINEVIGFLEREASHRNIKIYRDYDEGLPNLISEKGKLQQVFLNIINNALAAVPDNGKINLAITRGIDETLVFMIKDNGSGISEENLHRIFEPFFSTKGDFGTGLGLSITYDLVQKLGGDIKVDSKLNEGTTFTVILPQKKTEGGAA